MSMVNKNDTVDEFDWVEIRKAVDAPIYHTETFKEKFIRRATENPLVPIGCLATVGALAFGLMNFYKGDQAQAQKMMRLRVGAQGFTICALIAGMFYAASKKPTT